MLDENVDDLQTVLYAAFVDLLAQHGFRVTIVPRFPEEEFTALNIVGNAWHSLKPRERSVLAALDLVCRRPPVTARIGDRPTGERSSHFNNILLRISAVDAERVQFHQLACVVFVQPAIALSL